MMRLISSWWALTALLTATSTTKQVQAALRGRPTKVLVQVYDEALCGGCHEFILNQLIPVYAELTETVLDVEVVPFGNAKIKDPADPATLQCQHGVAECDANSYQQCAAALYPTARRYLPFVACLYETLPMGHADEPFDATVFATCAVQSVLDWSSLQACHDDPDQAWLLQLDAQAKTPTDHQYVPWILVDGQHYALEDPDVGDFLSVVCAAYQAKGGTHPACPNATAVGVTVASSVTMT